jgi:HPt (histidine-containing phosphotransfer) domain-containing protein
MSEDSEADGRQTMEQGVREHEVREKKITDMLEAMWEKSLPAISERIATLRAARERLKLGSLQASERKEAESAAHKLAGILGTFGLPEGSALASKIERLFSGPSSIEPDQQDQFSHWLENLEAQIALKR